MRTLSILLLFISLACSQPAGNQSSNEPEVIQTAPQDEVTQEETSVDDTADDTIPVEEAATKAQEISTSNQSEYMVYVTDDGDKYHTADCRYSKTAHSVSLNKAKADGKAACGICKPSSTTGQKQARCSGTTAEGKRCQRLTSDASGKCFQHR